MGNTVKYKDFIGTVEFNSKRNQLEGEIKGIKEQVTFSGTHVDELRDSFRKAVDEYIQKCEELGKAPQKSYKGSFNIRIEPGLHKQATYQSIEKGISLNQFVENAILEKVNYSSESLEESGGVRYVSPEMKDLPDLTRLMLELWPDCQYDEEYRNTLKILNDEEQQIYLALSGSKVIGFIYLSLRRDYVEGVKYAPVAYLEGIYIEADYRKQGISKTFIEMAKSWSLGKGCVELASDAELTNQISQDFHEVVGFKEVNRIVCYTLSTVNPSHGIST